MRLRPTLFVVVGPARSVRAGSAIFVAMVALVALVGLLAGGCRKERNWAACALPDDGCKRGFQCIEQRCVADGELDADVVGAPGDAGVDRAPGGEIDVGPDPRSCTSDDECSRKSPAAPTCQNGTCEACKGNEGCAGRPERPICDGKTGRCVGCVAVADCSKDPEKPVCAGNVCVPCNQAAPGACMATTRAMCAPSTGRCVDCQSPKDCVGKAGPLCVAGQCVKCNAMGVPATACEEQVPGRAVCDATLGCVECAAA